ncbi:hypothetical protein PR048_009991 [Dryococelus australis]|uniref:Uncharacterized protein n=1 Tax=Dryococelus australis TaxID=614101 RepID=A0ABQ9I1V8_9NEOP|nr:hypothetical protein PR048_009991 [Dryococelus australis]
MTVRLTLGGVGVQVECVAALIGAWPGTSVLTALELLAEGRVFRLRQRMAGVWTGYWNSGVGLVGGVASEGDTARGTEKHLVQ